MSREGNPSKSASERLKTRKTLVESIKRQDPDGWHEFSAVYGKLFYGLAIKAGCTPEEAQDAMQETLISVAKDISKFDTDPDRGSFGAWLMTIARRRIVDQLRRRPPEGKFIHLNGTGTATRTPRIHRIPDTNGNPVVDWDADWRQGLFDAALERIKTLVNPVHYKIFFLAVIKEKPVREVAKALDVSSPQVYLMKHRISKLLKKEVKRLEAGERSKA